MIFRLTAAAMIGLSAPAAAANLGPLEFDFVITDFVHNGDPDPRGGLLDVILSLPEKPAPPPGTYRDNLAYWEGIVFNIRAPAGKVIAVNFDANRGSWRGAIPGSFEFDVRSLSKGQFPERLLGSPRGSSELSMTYESLDGETETFDLMGFTEFALWHWDSEAFDARTSSAGLPGGENVIQSSGMISFGENDVLTNIRVEITRASYRFDRYEEAFVTSAGQPWDLFSASFSVHSLDGSNGPMTLSLVDAPAPVPLPGTGPFALAGIAVLAAVARHRRADAVSG